MAAQTRDFSPDCYAICSDGHPMPARFVDADPESGFITVSAPNGREYTFPGSRVVGVSEAEAEIQRTKVAHVASTYRFETLKAGATYRVIRCSDPARPSHSYIITTNNRRCTCNCPAAMKDTTQYCKHVLALAEKDRPAPSQEAQVELAKAAVARGILDSHSSHRTYSAEEW
jgi:hypothetical protein